MADIVVNTPVAAIGGIALKAAGAITATTAHTEVHMGTGDFAVQMDWTACKISANDETYLVAVEGKNGSTWTRIGILNLLGAVEIVVEGDAKATGSARAAFYNPYGGLVRLKTWIGGTLPSINFSAKAYPIKDLSVAG
jgi:hypothetical protein